MSKPQTVLRANTEMAINNRLNCQLHRPPRAEPPREPVEEPVEEPAEALRNQEHQRELDLIQLVGPPRLVRQHAVDLQEFVCDQDKENNNEWQTRDW
jgi:hypothetical protein